MDKTVIDKFITFYKSHHYDTCNDDATVTPESLEIVFSQGKLLADVSFCFSLSK